jgi:hypothetical protein
MKKRYYRNINVLNRTLSNCYPGWRLIGTACKILLVSSRKDLDSLPVSNALYIQLNVNRTISRFAHPPKPKLTVKPSLFKNDLFPLTRAP